MTQLVARKIRSIALGLALLGAAAAAFAQERAFDFALIGDMPYSKAQELEYQRVLSALNAVDLALVVHIGDFQVDARRYNANPVRASMPCVDENYKSIHDSFQTVRHPLILTPGDNDWSDCWLLEAKKTDPLELLSKLRTLFFPEGKSLGQKPIAVRQQSADPAFSKFHENLRWSRRFSANRSPTCTATRTPFASTSRCTAARQAGHSRTSRVWRALARRTAIGSASPWIQLPQLFRFKAEVVPGNTVNGER